jgi:ABC-type polysaccharide/polyol phosphate transport system ATPase subunit
MSDIILRVENLSKIYRLYEKPIDRLKETLNPFGKKYHHEFYALRDVSFDIVSGETIGIIGRNGAGKSTLLKIITGVLAASSGRVEVQGRIASLLELGAGFNPEYTGLENVYFQGKLMGFDHSEMDEKVAEILAFADIGDFISQPVKSYSSGMFARLAFSVAINVDPDILIVDEVLSVGDISFQAKCIRKMEEFGTRGKTILFVSHDMQTIRKFCSRVVWIHDGVLREHGDVVTITQNYISLMTYGLDTIRHKVINDDGVFSQPAVVNTIPLTEVNDRDSFGKGDARISHVGFFDGVELTNTLVQGKYITFICEFNTTVEMHDVAIGVLFSDALNIGIFSFNSYMYNCALEFAPARTKVRALIRFKIPKIYPKEYNVTVALAEGTQMNHMQHHWIHSALTVQIASIDFVDMNILSLYPDEVSFEYEILENTLK